MVLSVQISQSKWCCSFVVKEPQPPSPLVGEVGARSAPGGGLSFKVALLSQIALIGQAPHHKAQMQ